MRICKHLEYRSHTKPAFLKLKTDLVKFKSMVLMYMIYNKDTRQAGHFKNMYCRTTPISACLSVIGHLIWNKLHSDLKNSTNVNMLNRKV